MSVPPFDGRCTSPVTAMAGIVIDRRSVGGGWRGCACIGKELSHAKRVPTVTVQEFCRADATADFIRARKAESSCSFALADTVTPPKDSACNRDIPDSRPRVRADWFRANTVSSGGSPSRIAIGRLRSSGSRRACACVAKSRTCRHRYTGNGMTHLAHKVVRFQAV